MNKMEPHGYNLYLQGLATDNLYKLINDAGNVSESEIDRLCKEKVSELVAMETSKDAVKIAKIKVLYQILMDSKDDTQKKA